MGMAAYLIGHITIKDHTSWQTYTEGVRDSLLPYEAEIIFRGRLFDVLAGEHSHENAVVIKFPNQDTLMNWYQSKEYQSLIPIRNKGAEVTILCFDA
jgi:uncharacterized protein (DUF1330 family)